MRSALGRSSNRWVRPSGLRGLRATNQLLASDPASCAFARLASGGGRGGSLFSPTRYIFGRTCDAFAAPVSTSALGIVIAPPRYAYKNAFGVHRCPPVMMRLYMTRRSSLHTVYSDPEGHTLYKVRTPFTLAKGRRWDISRAKEYPSPYPAQREYDALAQIHWRRDLTTLSIGEQSIDAANFFRRTGLYGRSLSFTGPDGYEYKWVLGTIHPQLVRVDEKQTLIAKYYKERHKVPFIKHRPAYLDIFPPGEGMADIIFITFLYIRKVRHDRLNVLRSLQDDGLE